MNFIKNLIKKMKKSRMRKKLMMEYADLPRIHLEIIKIN